MSDETKVLAALASAGAAGLTQTQISVRVFGRHRTKDQLRSLLDDLATRGAVESQQEAPAPGGDKPALRWREIVNSHSTSEVEMGFIEKPPNGVNSHSDKEWTPPAGEGWVPWPAVVKIAKAGVWSGYAIREGRGSTKKGRSKKLQRQTWSKAKRKLHDSWTDQQCENWATQRIVTNMFRGLIYRKAIERRGDWCRLLRDPQMEPKHRWTIVVYQVLGEAHPTLTGVFTLKPSKTLASVMQEHLGRQLLPEEFVRRRVGKAGSWEPADMQLHSRLLTPSGIEENQRRLDEYRARHEAAPIIQKRQVFKAKMPKQTK